MKRYNTLIAAHEEQKKPKQLYLPGFNPDEEKYAKLKADLRQLLDTLSSKSPKVVTTASDGSSISYLLADRPYYQYQQYTSSPSFQWLEPNQPTSPSYSIDYRRFESADFYDHYNFLLQPVRRNRVLNVEDEEQE